MSENGLVEAVVTSKNQVLLIARRAGARDEERVFQDVCIVAWEYSHRAEGIRNVDAWIRAVTRNLTRSLLRRDKSRFARLPDNLDEIGCASLRVELAPSADIEREELSRKCREAIDRLPSNYHEIVDACDLGGLSIVDFAAAKNCPVETCRTRRKRARRCLQHDVSLQRVWEVSYET